MAVRERNQYLDMVVELVREPTETTIPIEYQ
jgi:hypothetical protein